jgi:hypothetical protein
VDQGEPRHMDNMRKNCPGPEKLVLKIHAQVLLLKNISVKKGLVNGARGVVVAFRRPQTAKVCVSVWCVRQSQLRSRTTQEREAVKQKTQAGVELFPCVRFACGEEMLITSELFTTEIGGQVVASRTQVTRFLLPIRLERETNNASRLCRYPLSLHGPSASTSPRG